MFALYLTQVAEAKKSTRPTPPPSSAGRELAEAADAANESITTGRENCFLLVTTEYKLGRREELAYEFEMENRQACSDLRDLYATSFSPAEVKKKTVAMRWTGRR